MFCFITKEECKESECNGWNNEENYCTIIKFLDTYITKNKIIGEEENEINEIRKETEKTRLESEKVCLEIDRMRLEEHNKKE